MSWGVHPMSRAIPWRWGLAAGMGTCGAGERLAARAVETDAPVETLFLWLCQLRRAPYSYDWIDNFGRRSPRTPDPALTDLEVGQRVMTIFTLIDFEPGRSMTIVIRPGLPTALFGGITVRYAIVPSGSRSILRGDLCMPPAESVFGRLRRRLLAWGDLLMMRRQLLTLVGLAERYGRRGAVGGDIEGPFE